MSSRELPSTSPNIVIFGQTGAGKSSVINLIAGRSLARTSDSAFGCTFEHQSHEVAINGRTYRLWDTTGLDEGSEGTVPADKSENNLKELIRGLARTGGITLIMYCFRAARFKLPVLRNYEIFYSRVCRKKVPIALVVTGLEHWENGMDAWWGTEREGLHRRGLHFDAHVCVTTSDIQDDVIQGRRLESQRLLRNLVLRYSNNPPWKIGESFLSQISPVFRDLLVAKESDKELRRTVIVRDMSFNDRIECPPGVAISWHTYTCSIADRQYEFIRTDARIQDQRTSLQGVGGLLVFYTSPLVDASISLADSEAVKDFYDAAGGLACPMIIVLRGCHNVGAARACWDTIASSLAIQAYPAFLPHITDDSSGDQTELMMMVDRLWTNPVGLKPKRP